MQSLDKALDFLKEHGYLGHSTPKEVIELLSYIYVKDYNIIRGMIYGKVAEGAYMSNFETIGEYVECNHCQGKGIVYLGYGSMYDQDNYTGCPKCNGQGSIYLVDGDEFDGY